MNHELESMAANAVCFAAERSANAISESAYAYMCPSVMFRPRVFIDGNQWCALYGENIQDGVAGFGDSPAGAMADFDRNWRQPLGKPESEVTK